MNIVVLPMKEAVELAVKQNIERDIRLELTESPVSEEERKVYVKEAEYLLSTTGENYAPEFPDHQIIRVGPDPRPLTEEDRKHSEFP